MSKPPSTETKLRNANSALTRMTKDRDHWRKEAFTAQGKLNSTIAERDEWKSRFDKLLGRLPKLPA